MDRLCLAGQIIPVKNDRIQGIPIAVLLHDCLKTRVCLAGFIFCRICKIVDTVGGVSLTGSNPSQAFVQGAMSTAHVAVLDIIPRFILEKYVVWFVGWVIGVGVISDQIRCYHIVVEIVRIGYGILQPVSNLRDVPCLNAGIPIMHHVCKAAVDSFSVLIPVSVRRRHFKP